LEKTTGRGKSETRNQKLEMGEEKKEKNANDRVGSFTPPDEGSLLDVS